jgi:formamidopyrimidine-DNA glycosylase
MPELPEVETVARDLRGLILGTGIVDARCDWPRTLRTHPPDAFAAALRGRTIEGIGRRAKELLVELSGGLIMTIHLKMTGQLFVTPSDAPADGHVHLVLDLADGRQLRFRDIRKFGRVGLYRRDEATGEALVEGSGAAVFGGHGPEPLGDGLTVSRFRELLRARHGRLKPLLMDQTFLAGIGNIYADEALWRARLHPLRGAASLRPDEERRLHAAIREILGEAVERRGSSVDDYTAPGGDGTMQERLQVYQRTGAPGPRGPRPIRRIVVSGRATHFCSWCQRLPVQQQAGAAAILDRMTPARNGAPARDLRTRTERTRSAAATRRDAARAGVSRPVST